MNQRPKYKSKHNKTIRKNYRHKSSWPWFYDNNFLNKWNQKHKQQKEKKLVIIRIKNLCASKGTIEKAKWQSTEWEKMFANHISGKGGTYIYLEYIKNYCNPIKRQRSQSEEMDKGSELTVLQRR